MKFFLRSCAILALSLNLLAPGIAIAAPDKLVLATGNLSDAAAAVSIPVLTEAYQRLGIKLEVQPFPFGRSLLLANEGSVDGELYRIAGMQTEYKNLVMVDVPIAMAEVAVFTNLPKLEPSFDNVRPYKLAYVRGSKLIEATLQGYQTLPLTDCQQIAEMLQAGRIEVALMDATAGRICLKQANVTGVRALDPPLLRAPLYHYLNVKHQALVPRVQAVLQTLEREGFVAREQAKVREKAGR